MTPLDPHMEIVITGMGSVSAFGPAKGMIPRFCVKPQLIKRWSVHGARKALLVPDFSPSAVVPGLKTRRLGRLSIWALVASSLALKDAGIELASIPSARCGVVVGTGLGATDLTRAFCGSVSDFGCGRADAIVFPETLDNSAGCHVARHHNLKGPNVTVSCRGLSGESALLQAASILENEEADLVIAIAGDVLAPIVYEYYESIDGLSAACLDPDDPATHLSSSRGGVIPGEGMAAVVMQRAGSPQTATDKKYCSLHNWRMGADPSATPSSWGRSAETTAGLIRMAMGTREASDVRLIVAARNGLSAHDAVETGALREVFGTGSSPAILTPKDHLGEFDASAILRLAWAISARHPEEDLTAEDPGEMGLLLGSSVGGGRAALVFTLSAKVDGKSRNRVEGSASTVPCRPVSSI